MSSGRKSNPSRFNEHLIPISQIFAALKNIVFVGLINHPCVSGGNFSGEMAVVSRILVSSRYVRGDNLCTLLKHGGNLFGIHFVKSNGQGKFSFPKTELTRFHV